MPFRVSARTLLQLGAELISSDAIALYELIKNAFDAGSSEVVIQVVIRLPFMEVQTLKEMVEHGATNTVFRSIGKVPNLSEAQSFFKNALLAHAPEADALRTQVDQLKTWAELADVLSETNYIVVSDTGEGMTLQDLDDIYLLIGTHHRLDQRQELAHNRESSPSERPILGEKGIGRLSVMRLGQRLRVITTKREESNWNTLTIDWSLFAHASHALLDEIDVHPEVGSPKDDPRLSGTTIRISDLNSEWNEGKCKYLALEEFSKLMDPFAASSWLKLNFEYNNVAVKIPPIEQILFEIAHAVIRAEYRTNWEQGPRLSGSIRYREREKIFAKSVIELSSIATTSSETLCSLGPFNVLIYWYNRRVLTAIDGVGAIQKVRDLIARWSGGLKMYRDGFRVNPYGGQEDDWLGLDRKAFSTSGFKMNRGQIIGKVSITSEDNPYLVDQTNREGLRDTDEMRALIKILKNMIESEIVPFFNKVDEDQKVREPLDFRDMEERVALQETRARHNLQQLLQRYPATPENESVVGEIESALEEIYNMIRQANILADEYERGRTELLHLAGLGILVEILAHELNRATEYTLAILAGQKTLDISEGVKSLFATLEAQLKTLQKRLRILDPLSTTARQKKESFNLISWIREILETHQFAFVQHGIQTEVEVAPYPAETTLRVRAVKGMIVQVLENLISNSIYWLNRRKQLEPNFTPKINITIDTEAKEIRFTDNGPGVDPRRREDIFQPFVTDKPPGEGKGLGLYIARELSIYNGANLFLSDQTTDHPDRYNTFIFVLEDK